MADWNSGPDAVELCCHSQNHRWCNDVSYCHSQMTANTIKSYIISLKNLYKFMIRNHKASTMAALDRNEMILALERIEEISQSLNVKVRRQEVAAKHAGRVLISNLNNSS